MNGIIDNIGTSPQRRSIREAHRNTATLRRRISPNISLLMLIGIIFNNYLVFSVGKRKGVVIIRPNCLTMEYSVN